MPNLLLTVLAVLVIICTTAVTFSSASFSLFQKHSQEVQQSKPQCPADPRYPKSPTSAQYEMLQLPDHLVKNISNSLRKTLLAPCTAGAFTPSVRGFSAAIVWGNRSYFISAGCSDITRPNASAVTEHTVFRLASVTKTITTKLILGLVEEGVIAGGMDEPVSKYAPGFTMKPDPFTADSPPSGTAGVDPTFRAMLSQMAGMPRESPCAPPCNLSLDAAFALLADEHVIAKQWTLPSYSNLAFNIIGLVAARLKNTTYRALVDKLAAELGMPSTGTTDGAIPDGVLARFSKFYGTSGDEHKVYPLLFNDASGGAYSTASDMARYLRMWIDKWHASALHRQNVQPLWMNGGDPSLPYGSPHGFSTPWELYTTRTAATGRRIIPTKGGDLPGTTTTMAFDPKTRLGFALLTNGAGIGSQFVSMDVMEQLLEHAIPALQRADELSFIAPPASFLSAFVGAYSGVYQGIKMDGAVTFNSSESSVHLRIPAIGQNWRLRWFADPLAVKKNKFEFQISIPSTDYPFCTAGQFAAYDKEWIIIEKSAASGKKTVKMPGFWLTLTRES